MLCVVWAHKKDVFNIQKAGARPGAVRHMANYDITVVILPGDGFEMKFNAPKNSSEVSNDFARVETLTGNSSGKCFNQFK